MGFFSEYREVKKILQQKQQVIFYAESRHYYQYFKKLIDDLLAKGDTRICYITSDPKDELLVNSPEGMKVAYVKWLLGFFFPRAQADVMIMTMPDLGNFLFKRSPGVSTYIYMFHAAVSTHQQYNKAAFFNYDAVFCTGDYQVKEIRAAEKLYRQPQKELIQYGYPLFDAIKEKTGLYRQDNHSVKNILIAPSWFEGCIFDACMEEMLTKLSAESYHIYIRSHPEYEKRRKKEFRKVKDLVSSYSNMSIDTSPSVTDRLPGTDILITDRSGIAFEFALGVRKPVLFIDTALKQRNAEWRKLDCEPLENSLRGSMGISLFPEEMEKLPQAIRELENRTKGFNDEMEKLLKEQFYNSDKSYKEGVEYIRSKIGGNKD